MDPRIRFLIALGSAIRNGAVKTIKQAMAFAKREFGEIDKSFVDDIVKVFKKEGKTKKGEVVPIKTEEGIMAADAATEIVKKRTKDMAKGDVTGETSDLMKGLKDKMTGIKKAADEMKDIANKSIKNPYRPGGPLDPKIGIVRAAVREILHKNLKAGKIKIPDATEKEAVERYMANKDPIDIFRKTFGENALDVMDAWSDDLLQIDRAGGSLNDLNKFLQDKKLFEFTPKKTYGYDQSIVTADKIRKAKEQEAKNKQLLEEFEIDPDREPNANGGIAGQLHLNRTGFKVGSGVKIYNLVTKYGPEFKKFAEALFIKASNMIRQGKGMWKGLSEKQRIVQHDNLVKKIKTFEEKGTLEDMDQYFGVDAEKAFIEARAKVQKQSTADEITKGIADVMQDTSEAGLARSIEVDNLKLEFPGISDEMIENILTDTNPQRIAEVKATMKEALKMQEKGMGPDEIIQMFKKTPRTKQAHGGLINILKL